MNAKMLKELLAAVPDETLVCLGTGLTTNWTVSRLGDTGTFKLATGQSVLVLLPQPIDLQLANS